MYCVLCHKTHKTKCKEQIAASRQPPSPQMLIHEVKQRKGGEEEGNSNGRIGEEEGEEECEILESVSQSGKTRV